MCKVDNKKEEEDFPKFSQITATINVIKHDI